MKLRRPAARQCTSFADVGSYGDVKKIAAEALNKFDGFDTWVNNAGVSIYGKLLAIPVQDMRQLFETNFWGMVYGSLVAASNMKTRGGAIINIGSTLSDRAIPLQGSTARRNTRPRDSLTRCEWNSKQTDSLSP
jgi:short-subunit dehydrogenase